MDANLVPRAAHSMVGDVKRALRKLPGYRQLRDMLMRLSIRYRRGVFRSFADARQAIPSWRRVGYDHREAANLYVDHLDWVKPGEEPLLRWVSQLVPDHRSFFDFGGNIGRSYYVYRRLVTFPSDLRWLICDVPAVVEAGRELAWQRQATGLAFTTEFSQANGHDVLLTCGALHYVEQGLAELLAPLSDKPRHLLINRVPLWERPTYYTIMDIGPACCPYRVGNRAEFIASLERVGYELVDSWPCPDTSCHVLFRPSLTLSQMTGMYFRRATTASQRVDKSILQSASDHP